MSDHQDITIISPNSGNNNNKQQPINTTTTTSLPTRILLGLASGNSDHHGSSTSSITLTSSHQDNVLSTSSTSNTTTQHLHPVQISSSKLVSIPATTTSSGSPAVLKQLPQLVLKPVGSGGGHSNPVATSLLSSSTSAAGSTNQPNVLTIASGGHSGGQFQIPISIISAGKAGQVQMVAAGGGSGASTISLSSTNSSNSSNITGGSGTISAGSSPASATSSSTDASNDNEQGSQGQGQQQGSGNQQQQNGPFTRTVPIMDKGLTQCIRCGSVGMKDAFYGRNKSFCSNTCVRGIATTTTLTGQTVQAGPNQTQQPLFKIISMPYKSGTGEGGAQGQTQMLAMPIAIGSGGKGSIGSSSNTSGGASSLVLQGITPISSSGSTSSISTPILATSTTGNRLIIRQQPTTSPVQVGGGGGGKITTKQLPLRLSASANQAGSQVVVTSQSGSQTLYNISAQQFAILRAQMAQHSNQQQQQQQQQQEAAAAQAQQAANNQANSGKGNNSMKRSYSKVSIATAGGTKVQEVAVTPTTPSNSSAKRSKRNSTSSSGSNVSAASVGTSGSSANIVTSVTAKKSKGGSGKVSISTPTTNLNTTFSSASSSTSVSSPSVKSSTNSITIFNTSSSTPTSSSSGPLITTVKPSTGAILTTTSTPTGQHHQQQQQQQNSILINQLMRKPVTSSSSSTTSQSQQDGSTSTISTSGLIPLSTLATNTSGGGGVTTSSSTTSAPTTNQFFVQFTGGTQGGKFISQQQLQMLMLKAQQQQQQAQAHAQQQAQQQAATQQQQQQNITIATTTTTATTNQQQQQPIRTTYKSNTTTHAPATIAATSTAAATPTSNAAAATTTGISNANENQYGNRLQHILNAQSNHHIQNQQAQVQQAHAQVAGATAQQQQPVATTLKLKPLTIAQMKQQSTVAATSQQQQQQITIKREIVQQTQQLQPVQLAAIVKTEPAQPVATLTATPPSVAPPPPAPPAPPSPPELTKEQEIKQLESAIKLALANNPTTAKNLYTSTPPVWWLILEKYGLDRCAPLTAFSHFPMRNEWSDYVNGPVCFEIKLLPDHHPNGSNGSVGHNYFVFSNANGNGGNGNGNGGNHSLNNVTNSPGTPTTPTGTPNKSGGKKKNSELNGNFFWFVKIVANSGCYLRLRYVGLENNTSYDFWINFRLRNLFPVGYAKSKGHKMKLPPEVEQNALSTYQAALRSMLASCKNVRMDLHSRFVEQIQLGWMKTGLRLEAQDKTKSACYRPATVDQLIGDRIHVRYDGDPAVGVSTGNECDIQGLWTHLQSGQLRPIGWSQLVGHELFACEEFATKSLERALDGVRHHIKSGNRMANEWGVVTRTELFDDKNLFKEGMKLEAIDPFNQLAICVVTIRKVLRFGFLLLSIDNHLDDPKETAIFCAHCSSSYLLPAGFCKVKGITLQTPIGYNREFNWTDYCIYTESVIAPINIFPRQLESQSANQFTEGMLLEAVDLLEPNLICIAVVKRVVDHLVMLHFIGWGDNLDQWCDCRSPNIFPVGYCDLVQYPLQGPPGKDGGAATPTNKASRKGRSKRKSGSGSKALLNALEDGQPSLLRQKMEDDKRKVNSLIQKMLNSNTNTSFTNGNSSNDLMDDSDSEHSVSVDKETKEAKQNSIEEYNFTSNLEKISSVPQSTSENSLLFNNIDDLIDDTKKINTDLVIQLHNRKRIHLGRKATYEDDDDFADTRAPPIETVMIDDDGLRAEFRFYNEGLEDEEFDADKSSRLVSSEDYSVVLNKTMYKEVDVNLRELTKVPAWTEYQVAKYLMMFGFDFVYNDVIRHKINGKRFLCLTETQAIKLTYSVASAKRLIAVVDKLKAKISSYLAQNSNNFNNRSTFGNSSNNSTISTAVTTASSALQQAQQQLQSIFKF